jgi:hypothetical protein
LPDLGSPMRPIFIPRRLPPQRAPVKRARHEPSAG